MAWDQAPQWGKKAKNGVKWEKYRRAKRAKWYPGEGETTSWLASLANFFLLFPTMRSLVPG